MVQSACCKSCTCAEGTGQRAWAHAAMQYPVRMASRLHSFSQEPSNVDSTSSLHFKYIQLICIYYAIRHRPQLSAQAANTGKPQSCAMAHLGAPGPNRLASCPERSLDRQWNMIHKPLQARAFCHQPCRVNQSTPSVATHVAQPLSTVASFTEPSIHVPQIGIQTDATKLVGNTPMVSCFAKAGPVPPVRRSATTKLRQN